MIEIVPGVQLLTSVPNHTINVYLAGDVLIDAGTRWATNGILRQLRNTQVRLHALTHVHSDHQGASKAVCERYGAPLWCGGNDADAMEKGDMSAQIPANVITRLQQQFWFGPAHPVEKRLVEGDTVGEFTVLDAPGHSPGHIAFFRESDRLLILGDVAVNMNLLTFQPGLGEPPTIFTLDIARNRKSLKKLADLRPRVICFGHGKPVYDGERFADFAAQVVETT